MKINTSRFGEIEVDKDDLLDFPEGLIGFPELNQFVLLNSAADSPFKWLQAVTDASMAFIVISPLSFRFDYKIEVSEEELSSIKLTKPDEAVISVIVTIPTNNKKISANLKAPLVFNSVRKLGKQIILKDPKFQTKHFILEEMRKFSQKDIKI